MDLPFAVDSPERDPFRVLSHSTASSLITATSQGTFSQGSFLTSSEPNGMVCTQPTTMIMETSLETEMIDFTFVHAESDADEVDVIIDGGIMPDDGIERPKGDILAILLSGSAQQSGCGESFVNHCEQANEAAHQAAKAKKQGDLTSALNEHIRAAKLFRDAAVAIRDQDVSLSDSLLLLSQAQGKSALVFKLFLKQHPAGTSHHQSTNNDSSNISSMTQRDRLRATLRGALVTKNEADISDSIFLGKATAPQHQVTSQSHDNHSHNQNQNPVDEMMELERELRDMDMALELGHSVASLGARTQNRMKQSTMEDGSFMVVPPGSSYMASSLWTPSRPTPRARPNRVQHLLDASTFSTAPAIAPLPQSAPKHNSASSGLESSWWGNGSDASHMMASSVVLLSNTSERQQSDGGQPTNTKQLMRLLDSIKALGDENAALLRVVDDAEAARMEAKATKDQMRRFKEEYSKRFHTLKTALEKFRKGLPIDAANPVTSSEFMRASVESEEYRKQELMTRKLSAELKKEKEESKKKDAALRKYESFYREVKARSALKAAERQKDTQQRMTSLNSKGLVTRAGPK